MAWLVSDTRRGACSCSFQRPTYRNLVDLSRERAQRAAAGPSSNWLALFSGPPRLAGTSVILWDQVLPEVVSLFARAEQQYPAAWTFNLATACSRVGPRLLVFMRVSGLYSIHDSTFPRDCKGRQQFHFLQGVEVACSQPLVQIHAPRSLPDDEIRVGRTILPRVYPYALSASSMYDKHSLGERLFLVTAWVVHANRFEYSC